MALHCIEKIKRKIISWLMRERPTRRYPLCDYERLRYELRPCDILLIEGQSRVSEVIKAITQSPWSHAAIYLGRLHDIENPILREHVNEYYQGSPEDQLLIESVLGKGTVVTPIHFYQHSHIRICRPKGISRSDANQVLGFAIGRLGMEYGIRHILDLARFLFPWSFLPRRWRSTLFGHNIGVPTNEICSSMLAEAFGSVKFPILPIVKPTPKKGVKLYLRNFKLYTPSDFDYSPYFEIIKYPIFELSEDTLYRSLPWEGEMLNHENETPRDESKPKINPEQV